ncbi:hypothetical protein BH09BAC5_BH09BAC5_13780 [soil metagenome]
MLKNATSKFLLASVVAFIFSISAFAQYSASEVKTIEKSKSLYQKGKYDKAIATLKKVQNGHFYDNDLWELRCNYEYDRYEVQFINDITKLLKQIKKGSTNFDLSKLKSTGYRTEMIGSCSMATLVCPKQETASWILHEQFLEPSVDSAVSDEAKDEFNKGSMDYSDKNYSNAIRSYEMALKLDSNYYNATYKLAMCYYKNENFEKAIPYFLKAIAIENEMLDPRQNLANCYIKTENWQEAYNTCVDGIILYPDIRYFSKMEDICEKLGKKFNRHWMSRDYLPSMLSSSTQLGIQDEPWSFYRQAKDKIGDYCNDDGIVTKKVEFTDQKYLEAYSWEFMLKKTTTEDGQFGFARMVQKDGFLDCFAMVSMYHISFSHQYIDFSKKNADRIRTYINTYLVR